MKANELLVCAPDEVSIVLSRLSILVDSVGENLCELPLRGPTRKHEALPIRAVGCDVGGDAQTSKLMHDYLGSRVRSSFCAASRCLYILRNTAFSSRVNRTSVVDTRSPT